MLFISPYLNAVLPQKVIICGVCKNVEKKAPYSIKIMEKIGSLFSDYRVIVYENNSRDKTPSIIRQWAATNPRVLALTERVDRSKLDQIFVNRLENGNYYAPEAIARARNIVLEKAMSEEYKDFTYLIWMDMDFQFEPNYAGFVEIFETNREWDAIFANGTDSKKNHWDWYAFRDDQCPLGSELLGNAWWYLPKKLVLHPEDDWYPVYSAFGGCGVYKKSSIEGCKYSGLVTKDLAD